MVKKIPRSVDTLPSCCMSFVYVCVCVCVCVCVTKVLNRFFGRELTFDVDVKHRDRWETFARVVIPTKYACCRAWAKN